MRRALLCAAALMLAACEVSDTLVVGGTLAPPLAPVELPAFFDCLREHGQAVVSAHRGGPSDDDAENALATLLRTTGLAPAFLEVDVALTRDGALVLMHDDTLDRTTTGSGAVRDHTLAEIKALRLRDVSGRVIDDVPTTLREALDWANGRAILELDVKRGVSYEDVVREVEQAGAISRVVFITYSIDGALRLARVAPAAMIYATIEHARDLDTLERRGVDLGNIVAWTGTGAPDEALIAALAARGVEARLGVFGDDRRGSFAGAAREGVAIVAVDAVRDAVSEIDAADGALDYAALQCAAPN